MILPLYGPVSTTAIPYIPGSVSHPVPPATGTERRSRHLTCTWKRDHITPIMASLHWLPVRIIMYFKPVLFVYKALNVQSPSYVGQMGDGEETDLGGDGSRRY